MADNQAVNKQVRVRVDFVFDPREIFPDTKDLKSFIGNALKQAGLEGEISEVGGSSTDITVTLTKLEPLNQMIEGEEKEPKANEPVTVTQVEDKMDTRGPVEKGVTVSIFHLT